MCDSRVVKVLLSASCVAGLTGCMGSNVYYVDERFSTQEQEQIREAAAMWEGSTGGSVHFDLVFGQRVDISESDRNVIVKTSAQAAFGRFPEMASEKRAALFHEGGAFESSIMVIIAERVQESMLRTAIAHEMGHALGLEHVPEVYALMYKDLNEDPDKCVTEVDLREVRRYVPVAAERPCVKSPR